MSRGIALAAAGLLLAGWAAAGGAADVNPPLAEGTVLLAGRTRLTVEVARTPLEQMRGLSGRAGLGPGRGMLFVYQRPQLVGIWMKDMRFPLDILWIREGRIVKIERQAPPIRPGGPETVYTAVAEAVLEVPAGLAEAERLRLGDRVEVTLP